MSHKNEAERTSPCVDRCGSTRGGDQSATKPFPLLNKFRTDRARYAYDGNTSAILKLDRITYELLDFIGTHPKGEVPRPLATRFPPNEVACSLSRLEALLEKTGIFRPVSIESRLVSPAFVARNWHRIAGKFDDLALEVTEDCNMRCRYCALAVGFKNVRVRSRSAMPWDTARRAIDFFGSNPRHQLPRQYIGFWGGEPLINFELITRCVEYARSRYPSITFGVTTNGTLLGERIRQFLVAHDLHLYVSLDGPREVHDKYRVSAKGKGSFETIFRNLRALKESAPKYYAERVRFQCVVSPGVDFRKLLDFFGDTSGLIGMGKVGAYLVVAGPKTFFTPALKSEFDIGLRVLEEMFLQKVVKENRNDGEFAFLRTLFQTPYLFIHRRLVNPNGWGENFHSMATCFPGNFKLLVRTNGKFLICEKSNDALEIGDVERGLDGEKICEIYRAYHNLHQNECRRCWALRLCSPCFVSDTRHTGAFTSFLDPEECEWRRQFWTDKLRKYASVLEQNPHAFDYLNQEKIFRARIPLLDFEPPESNRCPRD